MSLSQALKLARVELASLSGKRRVHRFGEIVRLFASEVAGTVALAPFAIKAQQLYNSIPSPSRSNPSADDIYLVKSIYYGTRPRNTVDLYLPGEATQQSQEQQLRSGLPVVLFVHGGVWAAGDCWHYAPLAASLARLGVITCVMQYTLYPDALVPQLVQEVSAAFDWALDNVAAYGGDANKVSLVGHSAGAQLCMMALLQRAQAAHAAAAAATAAVGEVANGTQHHNQQQQQQHLRMPQQFVGVTGVYDIAKHYAYEKDRGVHSLSTMLPAMGGFEHFAANSPSVILAAALQQQLMAQNSWITHPKQPQQQQQQQQQQVFQQVQEPLACDFYNSFSLSGESIAHRIGFDRGSDHYTAAEAGLTEQSLSGMAAVPHFPLEAAAHLPPVVLMSSCTDLTVPWYESAELYWRLFDCGVPVKHLVYNKVGHGEFVTNWPAAFTGQSSSSSSSSSSTEQHAHAAGGIGSSSSKRRQQWCASLQELDPYCRDLAVVVMGQQPVNFVRKSQVSERHSSRGQAVGGEELVGQADQSTPTQRDGARVVGRGSQAVPAEWN